MYNPAGSDRQEGLFNREWIELYNSGGSTVDLAGWQVGDSQDGHWAVPFPAQTLLSPGQALVVTGDVPTFNAEWGTGINRIQVADFPTLANSPTTSNETVAVRNALGTIEDAVNYQQSSGWPRIDGTQGSSIYLRPEGLSVSGNDFGANWAPATWGVYGNVFRDVNDEINHGSPGFVETIAQAPFTPSPDAAWSIAVLPDTQNYSKSSIHASKYTEMTEWIRDNRDAFKIGLVLHEGDIVNNNNTNNPSSGDQTSTQQWQNAQASMHVLNGVVPYIMAAGNHDYGTTNAQNRQTFFNDYFRAEDNPLVDPATSGILQDTMVDGELQNAYYEYTAPDGRELLILALEWEPRPGTVDWANEIAGRPEYADHTAILLTHAYLLGNNQRYTSARVAGDASGADLWAELVRPNNNFEIVLNGHFGGDGAGRLSNAISGHLVHQMFFNTQFETQGGNEWLRLWEFLDDGRTVRVRTYSPLLDLVRTDPDWQFEFQITPLPPTSVPGDYNDDGVVNAADYVVWRNSFGSTTDLQADGNGDGTVNEGDYLVWKQSFGTAQSGAGVAIVPEMSSWILLLTTSLAAWGVRPGHLRRYRGCRS